MSTWKGEWFDDGAGNSQISYYTGEFVNYGNTVYIATTTVPLGSPIPPSDMGNWDILVAGTNGLIQIQSVVLLAANWTLVNGVYEYTYSSAHITENSMVDIIPANSSFTLVREAELLPSTLSANGSVKIYSTLLPSGNIEVSINIIKIN